MTEPRAVPAIADHDDRPLAVLATTEPVDVVDAAVEARWGPVVAREFTSAEPGDRAGVLEFLDRLPDLDTREFLDQAEHAIYTSSLMSGFRGNWQHEHAKASACYTESCRRAEAAGRNPSCDRHALYSQAYRRVSISQGYGPGPRSECSCPADAG